MRSVYWVPLVLLAAPAWAQDQLDPAVTADLTLTRVATGLQGPTAAEFLPDGSILAIEQFSGAIRRYDNGQWATVGNMTVQTSGERGLLGMAIDPQFATSNRIYFYYSAGGNQRVGWARMDPQTFQVDTANVTVLLQGMAGGANHNGGGLAFGPDGYLYIGVGDTGCNCSCSPGTNDNNFFPTCLTNLHGKILRIDRDGAIPATNPLVNETAVAACGGNSGCGAAGQEPNSTAAPRTEIYSWGFRNPWRFSFDSETGHLWIGDVGEVTYEEVTISTGPGQHHGWPFREGLHGQNVSRCGVVTPQSGACKEPVLEYAHTESPAVGQGSITGGVFSNHCSWPDPWRYQYWFGDYNKNRVWSAVPNATREGVKGQKARIVSSAGGPVHFFNGPDGAVYYLSNTDGEIWRIAPTNPENCAEPDAGVDAGQPVDVGFPEDAQVPDSGATDAVAAPDALPAPDATIANDSGVADAGQRLDATASADAGQTEEEDEGCGCSTSGASGSVFAGLAFLLLLGLRRRR